MTAFETNPLEKQYVPVNGKQMAFHERSEGRSVVFPMGNRRRRTCGAT